MVKLCSIIMLLSISAGLFAAENLLIVSKGSNSLVNLNLESGLAVQTTVGYRPHEIAVSSEYAYVSNFGINHIRSMSMSDRAGRTISVIDLTSNTVIDEIDLGKPACAPHGLNYSHKTKMLYVSCEARYQLVAIDTNTNTIQYSVGTNQPGSHMLVVDSADEFAYIANFWIGTISVVDLSNRKLSAQVFVGRTVEGIDIDEAERNLYVSIVESNEVLKIDLENMDSKPISATTVGGSPIRVNIPNNSNYLFVNMSQTNEVEVYSAENLDFVKSIKVGKQPIGIASSTDGEHVYIANMRDNSISVIDTELLEVERTIKLQARLPDGIAFGRAKPH